MMGEMEEGKKERYGPPSYFALLRVQSLLNMIYILPSHPVSEKKTSDTQKVIIIIMQPSLILSMNGRHLNQEFLLK
jgi:hypothetical protein